MDIAEARKLKNKAESEIRGILNMLHKLTDLCPVCVDVSIFEHHRIGGDDSYAISNVKIKFQDI